MILKRTNPVFQRQFPALQPRNLQLVGCRICVKRRNGIIQIAMFNLQQFDLLPDSVVVHGAPNMFE